MNETTFILGAGASYGAGMPLAREIFDQAYIREVHKACWLGNNSLELRQTLEVADLVRSAGAGFQTLYDDWVSSSDTQAIDRFESAIDSVLFWAETATFHKSGRNREIASVGDYFSFAAWLITEREMRGSVNLLTFNYDLLVEHSLSFDQFNYGSATKRMFCPKESASLVGDGLPRFRTGIQILKPHGSMNWLLCSRCNLVRCGRDNLWRLQSLSKERCAKCSGPLRKLFVPPLNAQKADFLTAIWTDVAAALSRSKIVVVIGYSFPEYDSYVRDLVRQSLHPDAVMLIIDPTAFKFPERYKGLGAADVVATSAGFTDVMQRIDVDGLGVLADIVRPL